MERLKAAWRAYRYTPEEAERVEYALYFDRNAWKLLRRFCGLTAEEQMELMAITNHLDDDVWEDIGDQNVRLRLTLQLIGMQASRHAHTLVHTLLAHALVEHKKSLKKMLRTAPNYMLLERELDELEQSLKNK